MGQVNNGTTEIRNESTIINGHDNQELHIQDNSVDKSKENGSEGIPKEDNVGQSQQNNSEEEDSLEYNPKYQELIAQLQSCVDRKRHLQALLEEDPTSPTILQLYKDIEGVIAVLRKRIRALIVEYGRTRDL